MHFLQRRPSGDHSAPIARAGYIAATAAILLAASCLGTDDAAARGFGGFGGFHGAGQSRYRPSAPAQNRRVVAPQRHFNTRAARRNTHVAAPHHAATRHWHQARQNRPIGTHATNKSGTGSNNQVANRAATNSGSQLKAYTVPATSNNQLAKTTSAKTTFATSAQNRPMTTHGDVIISSPTKPVITSNVNSPVVLNKYPTKSVITGNNGTSPVVSTSSNPKPAVASSSAPPVMMTPGRLPQTPSPGTSQTGTKTSPTPGTTPNRPSWPSPTQTATNTPGHNPNIYVPPRQPPPPSTGGYHPPRPPHPPVHGLPLPLPLPLPSGPVLASVPPSDGGSAPPPSGPPTLRSNVPPGGGGGGGAAPPSNVATTNGPFVPDEILVRFTGNTAPDAIAIFTRDQRLALLGTYSLPLINTVLYQFRITDGRAVPIVLASLQGDGRIATSQPNYLYDLQQTAPPTASAMDQYAVEKLHLTQAHDLATGNGVLIAVIDTAIDAAQADMQGSIVGQYDAVKTPLVPLDHGTEMAGAIVAHGRLVGVAPGAHILAVRAFDASSAGGHATTSRLLDSLQWAATSEARIVSMSFAGPSDPGLQAMIAALHRKGVVLVAAAGNNGPHAQPAYPGAYPGVIAVTATDIDDRLLGLANRGSYIAVAAPGVDVWAAQPGGKYNFSTGTSIACAHVSGIAALMLQRNPQLTPDALAAALKQTAKRLGPKGRDDGFGAGLVDAYEAVLSQAPAVAQGRPVEARQ